MRASGGIYEMLAYNERRIEQLVSRTAFAGLDLVLSNDHRGELNTLLLHAPDGRLRLRHLLPALAPLYDLVLIDIAGEKATLQTLAHHKTSWHTQASHCHPTWSWDGSRIIYASDAGGKVNLYMVEP